MFNSHQKFKGTQYTATVALLIAAFIFSPAVLLVTRPSGYLWISLVLVFSAFCAGLAWLNWTRYSRLSVPSIETKGESSAL